MVDNFWKGKKVLITGDTGFKGSWLKCILLNLGSIVYGFSLKADESYILNNFLNEDAKFKDFKKFKKYIPYEIDIRDEEMIKKNISDISPEIIFHMAAQPLVIESYKNPLYTWQTNVIGTINILESIRELNSCSIVIVTTDKVYENNNKQKSFIETDILGGSDPYSSSKAATELAVKSWNQSFFKGQNIIVSTARAGNVIGGGDWSENRIVPDVINSLVKKEALRIRYPNAIRPWQHVLEPLFGYLKLAKYQYLRKEANHFNFGPHHYESSTVRELIDEIYKLWGSKCSEIIEKDCLYESTLLSLNIEKAKKILNWKPKWGFKDTVKYTVNWYKKNLDGQSVFSCIQHDIENYLNK
jgi:CDP-glucose 4,6-dehydratase